LACALALVVVLSGSDSGSEDSQAEGAAAPNVVQAGAPGEGSRKVSEDELAELDVPEPTEADVEFVQGMIHHHAQAVEMTAYVPERGVGRDVRLLAQRMNISQESEIELMEKWLEGHGEAAPSAGDHEHGHGGELMPGMLTEAQLARLRAADGGPFNRSFLQSMIRHHRGAFTMIEQLRGANGGLEPELDNLIRHIEADQGIEIDRMQRLLAAG
jgi:uncharacterized protein (DUF305 family)